MEHIWQSVRRFSPYDAVQRVILLGILFGVCYTVLLMLTTWEGGYSFLAAFVFTISADDTPEGEQRWRRLPLFKWALRTILRISWAVALFCVFHYGFGMGLLQSMMLTTLLVWVALPFLFLLLAFKASSKVT